MFRIITTSLLLGAVALPAIATAQTAPGEEWRRSSADGRADRRQDRGEPAPRAEAPLAARPDLRQDRRDSAGDRAPIRADVQPASRADYRAGAGDGRPDYRTGAQDRRQDRQTLAVNGRELQRSRVDDRRDDRRNDRPGWNSNGRDYRQETRFDDRRGWNDGWRGDRRYDWRGYRDYNREAYRLPRYYAPRGYSYRRWSPGYRIDPYFYGDGYWISDPYAYRLPPAYGNYRWIRYYDDVLLVDITSGLIRDALYSFFLSR